MGYSDNPITVEKLASTLEPLTRGVSTTWTNLPDPKAFAYKLREARAIVAKFPERFPQLAIHFPKYKIEVFDGTVHARYISEISSTAGPVRAETEPAREGAVVLDRPATIGRVVQAWLDGPNDTKAPILITNCEFSNEELKKLAGWAQEMGWMVLHQQGQTSVTIAPEDAKVREDARIRP